MLKNLFRAMGRVFPDCVTLSQAIAFNMFVAFFPLLLFALGLFAITSLFHQALLEIPARLSLILPPGTNDVVAAYFVRTALHPWRWITLGLGGTLIAGSQVMVGYIEGFRLIEGDVLRAGYWERQLRAILLLCLTIVPMGTVVVMTVFGKQTRAWLLSHTGSLVLTHELELTLYALIVFALAMVALVALYGIGRPGHTSFKSLLPGATVATVLWWVADLGFGWYVRKMPYDAVYRGLAAAIGLLLWMFLTAMIVLIGAAYNAEYRESSMPARPADRILW